MRCFDSIATALMAGCRMVIGALALVASQVPATGEYLVAPGDVVEVVVTGTPDWRQRSPVGADGTISLPILGMIRIAGLSVSEMQARVEGVLATRMFRQRMPDGREQAVIIQPGDVSATIAEYRPVYVEGDVLNPGAHSYRPSLTVRQLVALSGGYSVLRRVLAPNRDPVELHGEYKLLRTLLAREQIHAQRLRAELEGREEFAPDVAKDALVPSSALNETIQSESDALRTRRAELSQERAFLKSCHQAGGRPDRRAYDPAGERIRGASKPIRRSWTGPASCSAPAICPAHACPKSGGRSCSRLPGACRRPWS